jgi:hypothetical protein
MTAKKMHPFTGSVAFIQSLPALCSQCLRGEVQKVESGRLPQKSYPAQENPPEPPVAQLLNPDPPIQLTDSWRSTSLIPHLGQVISSSSLRVVKTSKSQSHASHRYS